MSRNRLILVAMTLCCCTLAFSSSGIAPEPDWRHTKMMWAHYVGWGFDQVAGFDQHYTSLHWRSLKYTDRTLLGKYVQSDSGMWEGIVKQVRCAMDYGFDGFCVDLFKNYKGNMQRFFSAAEGTPFKIALCIDGGMPRDELIEELDAFIAAYQDHPNSCRIDGRMVIFSYSLSIPLEDWKAALQELKARGREAFYLMRSMPENSLWDNIPLVKESLEVFDGLYDFGSNGLFPEEQTLRFKNARRAIEEARPDAPLVVGITTGYCNNFVGFYRPYLNSRTLRDNWQAAIETDADWVCITTWNDYIEHTHFEPSSINRDALCQLNLEYCNLWRGTPVCARPVCPVISYHEEVDMGADFTLDAVMGPYSGGPAVIHPFALDFKGDMLYDMGAFTTNPDDISVAEWRIPAEAMTDWRGGFRIRVALDVPGSETAWRELCPVAIRYGRLETLRTVRIPWNGLSNASCSLAIETEDGMKFANVTLYAWMYAGKLEVFRNGWPVAEHEFSVNGAPEHRFRLPLPPAQSAADFYVLRVSGTGDRLAWGNPVIDGPDEPEEATPQPVIVTGADFDENWLLWSHRISRFPEPKMAMYPVRPAEMFSIAYDFGQPPTETLFYESSQYSLPAKAGANHWNWYVSDPENIPVQVDVDGPDGLPTRAMLFDGTDDFIALPSRTMVYGAFTLEFLLRPQSNGKSMTIFSDASGNATVSLDETLHPVFERHKNKPVRSETSLNDRVWHRLACQYTGTELRIFIDGNLVATGPAAPQSVGFNSVPVIGANGAHQNGFCGHIKAFHLQSGILPVEGFLL